MPNEQKKKLRTELRTRLRSIDAAAMHTRSLAVSHQLTETPEFKSATAVMLFLSLTGEVDTRPIALRAWQAGKTVTVPLVSHEQKHMIPVVLRSFDEPMERDRYGVRTPSTTTPFPIDLIDLVIMPGLGFDRRGRRLGRGAGFFDRFLARREFGGLSCGLAVDEQLVATLPTADHDQHLDMLVTDTQVMRFKHERV